MESADQSIGYNTHKKFTGERSAGKSHATFDVAGGGNMILVLMRHRSTLPAKDKGIDNGYELVREKDKNGKWLTPQEGGLLTGEEKKKVEALKHRKPVTVTIE